MHVNYVMLISILELTFYYMFSINFKVLNFVLVVIFSLIALRIFRRLDSKPTRSFINFSRGEKKKIMATKHGIDFDGCKYIFRLDIDFTSHIARGCSALKTMRGKVFYKKMWIETVLKLIASLVATKEYLF